jgi:hypothetical protein
MSTELPGTVGALGFSEPMDARPKYHANDTSLDVLNVVPRSVAISDARAWRTPASLDIEGFALYPHRSAVHDFRDAECVARDYANEIRDLVKSISGAHEVVVAGRGILRFAERAQESGALDNSRPARFVHIDVSDTTARAFYARSRPPNDRNILRAAQYNIWRCITPPPQDVPLAVCDARTVAAADLISADAIFDRDGAVLFSFEALLLRHNPEQQWAYYSSMQRDEVLLFKTHDTDMTRARQVPHGAFDDPSCPLSAQPRASIEMRASAYWFE